MENPDIISTKMFLDVSIKLLMTSVRQLIRLNLMTSLLQNKIRLLAPTELPVVLTDVLLVWVPSCSLILIELAWKEVLLMIVC